MGLVIWRKILYLNMMSVFLCIPSLTEGAQIRLVGSSRCSGRVEIYYNYVWGTVCDDSWDLKDTAVVCRELDCGTASTFISTYGGGSGEIWLDDVSCSGDECSLTECSHPGFGIHDCKHSEDVGVVCSGQPSSAGQPSLSTSSSALSPGETLILTCSIPTWFCTRVDVNFYKDGSDIGHQALISKQTSGKLTLYNVYSSRQGSYTCRYSTGSTTSSYSSQKIIIVVNLPKPRISVNPVSEVTWGNTVEITCSISTQHLGGTFTFLKPSGSRNTQNTRSSSYTFNIPNVDFVHEGSYRCQYDTTVSSRLFRSPESDPVMFFVTVRLLQPNISLTTPHTELVWGPGHSEVTRGDSFSITCSILPQYPGGIFSLIFSGSNMTDMKAAVNHSASFQFPAAEYEHQGNYSCVYEVTVSTRNVISNRSELLTVTVNPSPIPMIVGGTVGGVLLLLLLLLIGLCLMWRRRHRRPAVKTDPDPTACVMNTYGNKVGRANEDDEEAYGNAEAFTCHQSDDDDSDDYENGDFVAVEEEDDAIYANTDMYPESSTKEHLNPGRRAVEGQSCEDEDNIYANYDG